MSPALPTTAPRPEPAGGTDDVVTVSGLRKAFGDQIALDGLDLRVRRGTILGLLGPNGAGKTTTINVLSTLLRPDAGRAIVAGHDVVTEAAEVRRAIGLTGQYAAVDADLTARESLVMFARLLGRRRAEARARATELLTAFDLGDAADRRLKTFSGGMRRRLDLAVSLVAEPEVLFLDEPTTGLDPRSRLALWDVVRDLRRRGVTVLLTTQYLEEADALADELAVIDHGRAIAIGTAAQLKDRVGGRFCEVVPVDPRRVGEVVGLLGDLSPVAGADGESVRVPAEGPATVAVVLERVEAAGVPLQDVGLRRPTLDDVFLALTGGHGA